MRCSLLLQMSHVAQSMMLSMCTGELCKNSSTSRDTIWGLTHVGIVYKMGGGSRSDLSTCRLKGCQIVAVSFSSFTR